MADPLITAQQLEAIFGPERMRRYVGDDGAGNYALDPVLENIDVASEDAYGILRAAGWTNAQIVTLAANDSSVRRQVAFMWRFAATQLKDEFRMSGTGAVFAEDDRRARDMLRQKASTALRTSAEELPTVGKSALISPRATAETPPSVFSRDRDGRPVGF